MKVMKILCLDDSELMEFNSINKGYRGDIYVKLNDSYYNLNFYDIVRLKQDFEKEIEDYGIFSPDPNIVIVKDVNKNEIKESIENLKRKKYFDEIKPLSDKDIRDLNFLSFS